MLNQAGFSNDWVHTNQLGSSIQYVDKGQAPAYSTSFCALH
ncbi:Uncharacterised protein [Vibrio cholerae]|nr:Uncharacterised protein [Vibrio cholerae]